MKTTMISAVICVLFSAAASAAWANGPMGNSSNSSAGSSRTTTGTANGNRGTFVGINGIVESSRQAADGLKGTEWSNRGVRGLWEGALESCSRGRYPWDRRNSCQGAADDRGRVIGERLEQMRRRGELGDYTVTVGSRNGYTVWGNSLHTDTAMQIRDRHGRIVGNYVIDNYVGRSMFGTRATPVSTGSLNFDPIDGNTTRIRTVGPDSGYRRGR